MRTLFVVLDGAADLRTEQLNNKTPLEAAYKPNLDWFARFGKLGYVYTVNKNVAPESDVAVTALLGYDPYKLYTGRGPLEAYGAGLKLNDYFLALRTNFATIDNENNIIDRRVGRSLTTAEAHSLAKAVNEKVKLGIKFKFKSTTEHRGVLVFYGKFSDKITNVDPAYNKVGKFGVANTKENLKVEKCKPLDKDAVNSAKLVNDFIEQSKLVLENHPVNLKRKKLGKPLANIILPRDAGNSLPIFPVKKGWAAVVGMPLEIGLTKLAGMQIFKVNYPKLKSANIYKHLYRSLNMEIKTALNAIKVSNKNLYIHFKETDIPGHDGLPLEKKRMIEMIDKKFFSKLRKLKNLQLVVTCDHTTPCKLKAHSADPVPLLIYNGKARDKVVNFSEYMCKRGSLGALMGKGIMKLL